MRVCLYENAVGWNTGILLSPKMFLFLVIKAMFF